MNTTDPDPNGVERKRAIRLIGNAVDELERDGGNLREFTVALLMAAIQIFVQVDGLKGLNRKLLNLASIVRRAKWEQLK